MKITLFLLLFVTFQAYCENGYSQSAKISIPRSTLKVSELLTRLSLRPTICLSTIKKVSIPSG